MQNRRGEQIGREEFFSRKKAISFKFAAFPAEAKAVAMLGNHSRID
jgi:hypothetical protein